ncbi:MAG: hypothetical protein U0935_16600 [Pirellulales bacterium]
MASSIPPPGASGAPAAGVSSFNVLRLIGDGVLALGLGGVLLLVYGFDLATSRWFAPPSAPELVETTVASPTNADAPVKRLRLAVSPHQFDDMGRLLTALGEGYRYDNLPLPDLCDVETLKRYDVIFLTCGGTPDEWQNGGGPPGRGRDEMIRSVRAFVEGGGTLYASDWRIQIVQIAFPELIDTTRLIPGAGQELTASVNDEGLKEVIGPTIHLNFDLGGWFPAAFNGQHVTTYLSGEYAASDGSRRQSPLLVKVPVGQGAIVFTSFHNEKQNSATELELLKYLVFTTVTARVQSEVTQTMVKGGFSSAKQNLLSTSASNPTVSATYNHAQAGALRFVLAFENQGARLRFEVVGPDGKKVQQEGRSTIQLDLPAAPAGAYKYTVTALEVPFENFPFTVTVGQKGDGK